MQINNYSGYSNINWDMYDSAEIIEMSNNGYNVPENVLINAEKEAYSENKEASKDSTSYEIEESSVGDNTWKSIDSSNKEDWEKYKEMADDCDEMAEIANKQLENIDTLISNAGGKLEISDVMAQSYISTAKSVAIKTNSLAEKAGSLFEENGLDFSLRHKLKSEDVDVTGSSINAYDKAQELYGKTEEADSVQALNLKNKEAKKKTS